MTPERRWGCGVVLPAAPSKWTSYYAWVRVTGPLAVLHTVFVVPVSAVFAASRATGPTLTPQMVAATFAATPMLALLSTLTSPTETFTSPDCCELFAALAGAAIPTPRSAVANSAAHVFLINSKSYLPFRVLEKRPSRRSVSLAWGGLSVTADSKPPK
jgi:hypothetical protein